MSLMKKGATITVYHKHEANKTLKIQVEESVAVGNPSLVGDADGIWSVPCDLTGFDASLNKSKKNKKKPIKIRFHADAFQKANKDLAFAKQMNAAGVKLLADLLGTAWSLEPPAKADPRLTHIKNLRQLLSETPIVTQSSTTVALTWLLKDKSLACDTIRSSVQCATNTDAKTAELRFIGRDNLNELLLLADVDESLVGSDCEVRADCLRWLLQKKVDKRTEEAQPKTRNLKPFRAWATVRLGPSKDRLRTMELTEARVLALRRALDDSVKIYQDGQNAARRSNGTHVRRPLTVIFRSKSAALLDISNAEPPPGPLHVTIDESMIGDSLSSSPADSVDSGVSASSESSVAANGAESMPGRIRQRSMSECYSYGHAPQLKGILKRRPKMCRSVSESYQEEDEEAAGERQNRIAAARRYTVDDEEDTPDSLAVSEAVSQTSLDADGNERPSKKRVSFNERVQERCFRPNSSILGQRKKNQKKHRKRQNSGDSTTTVSSEDEGAAIYRTLATQPPLPPAVKPRFFVGIVDTEDEDFQPATNTDQLLTTTTITSSRPTLQDMDNTIQDMDETIQDMDENIQDNGAPFDSNNNDSGGGSIDGQDFLTSEEPQPRSTKEPRKDSGLDFEGGDDLTQTEEEGVSEPDSPHPHWVSKNRVLAGKSTQQERKCSGDSGMSDDDVFAIIAEE